MPTASRRRMVAAGAVLALISGTVAWWAGGAAATPGRPVVAVAVAVTTLPEPTTSSSTTSSTSTTTTTSTSTSSSSTTSTSTSSTSTTPRPKPVTATIPVPGTTPPTAPPATPVPPAAAGASPAARCEAAQQWVAQQGLPLPAGWGFRCPGSAVVGGTPRWGMACWNCEGAGSWISIDIGRIGPSEAALRYVIAHETCHANEYMSLGLTTELTADLCAALHGAPRP